MAKNCCTGSVVQANACTMAIVSLLFGTFLFLGGIHFLYFRKFEKFGYLVMGILLIISSVSLLIGIIQEKKKCILLYLILGSTSWFVVTIFVVNHELHNQEWKKGYRVLFLTSLFLFLSSLWCCQFSVYQFYKKIAEYSTVNPGSAELVNRSSESTLILP